MGWKVQKNAKSNGSKIPRERERERKKAQKQNKNAQARETQGKQLKKEELYKEDTRNRIKK